MDATPIIVTWIIFGLIFGAFGAWVAAQRGRGGGEGLILGFLFGPLGVLVEALLPQGAPRPAAANGAAIPTGVDAGTVAVVVAEFEKALDAEDPNWRRLPYHRKRSLLGAAERRVASALVGRKMRRTQAEEIITAARRLLLG
jgi:uncharacterized membrane protein YeaQ/YmgE (transglycosylase-associated protein family)